MRHAYELDPIRPRVHYFLALALHEAGKNEEAVLFFEKALEHKFEFSDEIRWKLVDIFNKQKKYGQVLDLYKELLDETVPRKKFTTAMHTIINLMKNPKAALKLTETLAEKKTDNVFILNMHSWALVANEKYIEAEEVLKKAEELEPENPRTFLNFGVLYEAQNKFEAAKKFYKKSYELGSNTEQNTVTDLAAQKYNELIELEKEIPFTSDKGRPAHAP